MAHAFGLRFILVLLLVSPVPSAPRGAPPAVCRTSVSRNEPRHPLARQTADHSTIQPSSLLIHGTLDARRRPTSDDLLSAVAEIVLGQANQSDSLLRQVLGPPRGACITLNLTSAMGHGCDGARGRTLWPAPTCMRCAFAHGMHASHVPTSCPMHTRTR